MTKTSWPIVVRPTFSLIIVPAVAILVVLGLVGLQGCREIDRTVSRGNAYGYTIGDSKDSVFAVAKRQYANKDIRWLAPHIDSQASVRQYGIDVYQAHQVESVKDAFEDFQWWFIEGFTTSRADSVSLSFEFGESKVDMLVRNYPMRSSHLVDNWPNEADTHLASAMTSEEAFNTLLQLARRPDFRTLTLRAKDRRKIRHFDGDDLAIMSRWDVWEVQYVSQLFSPDFTRLYFEDGKLARAHRFRRFEPFPF